LTTFFIKEFYDDDDDDDDGNACRDGIPKRRNVKYVTTNNTTTIPARFCITIKISKHTSWVTHPGVKSADYDCLVQFVTHQFYLILHANFYYICYAAVSSLLYSS